MRVLAGPMSGVRRRGRALVHPDAGRAGRLRARRGRSAGFSCSVLACAGGLGAVTCADGTNYYYDPSGAFFAESGEGGVVGRLDSGICSFDPAAIACSLSADAGCP